MKLNITRLVTVGTILLLSELAAYAGSATYVVGAPSGTKARREAIRASDTPDATSTFSFSGFWGKENVKAVRINSTTSTRVSDQNTERDTMGFDMAFSKEYKKNVDIAFRLGYKRSEMDDSISDVIDSTGSTVSSGLGNMPSKMIIDEKHVSIGFNARASELLLIKTALKYSSEDGTKLSYYNDANILAVEMGFRTGFATYNPLYFSLEGDILVGRDVSDDYYKSELKLAGHVHFWNMFKVGAMYTTGKYSDSFDLPSHSISASSKNNTNSVATAHQGFAVVLGFNRNF